MHDMRDLFGDEKESEAFHNEIRKGFLKTILLNIIREKPIHGYEIIHLMQEKSNGRWTPSPGSIYPALEYLESKGYIASQEVERKKVYTITPLGEQAIERMREHRRQAMKELAAFLSEI